METVTFNLKEQKRLLVLNRITHAKFDGKQATELLDLSLRHVRRMPPAYRKPPAGVSLPDRRRCPAAPLG